MAKLDAHQPFIDWRNNAKPDAGAEGFVLLSICTLCKALPERAQRYLDRLSTEELRDRMLQQILRARIVEEGQ